jgi:hypothetical protein
MNKSPKCAVTTNRVNDMKTDYRCRWSSGDSRSEAYEIGDWDETIYPESPYY